MATINFAYFVNEVKVIDPETKKEVVIAIFKHHSGGMFGIDKDFIEKNMDEEEAIMIADPLSSNAFVELEIEIEKDQIEKDEEEEELNKTMDKCRGENY